MKKQQNIQYLKTQVPQVCALNSFIVFKLHKILVEHVKTENNITVTLLVVM